MLGSGSDAGVISRCIAFQCLVHPAADLNDLLHLGWEQGKDLNCLEFSAIVDSNRR